MITDKTYFSDTKHVLVKALRKKGYTEGCIYFNPLVRGEKREYLGFDVESAGGGIARLKDNKQVEKAEKEGYGF